MTARSRLCLILAHAGLAGVMLTGCDDTPTSSTWQEGDAGGKQPPPECTREISTCPTVQRATAIGQSFFPTGICSLRGAAADTPLHFVLQITEGGCDRSSELRCSVTHENDLLRVTLEQERCPTENCVENCPAIAFETQISCTTPPLPPGTHQLAFEDARLPLVVTADGTRTECTIPLEPAPGFRTDCGVDDDCTLTDVGSTSCCDQTALRADELQRYLAAVDSGAVSTFEPRPGPSCGICENTPRCLQGRCTRGAP